MRLVKLSARIKRSSRVPRTPKCEPRPKALRGGFTLIELMIVLGLLGVLVAIAISGYDRNIRLAKRSEAYSVLSGIYKAQVGHRALHGQYADTFDDLGFEALGAPRVDERTLASSVYTFTVQAITRNGVPGANFRAMATGDLDPGDGMMDILMIENDLTIVE